MPGSVLSIDGLICDNSTQTTNLLDANCQESYFVAERVCVVCELGYFFNSTGSCSACPGNCAICDPIDNTICIMCLSGYYMNIDGFCIIYSLMAQDKGVSSIRPEDIIDQSSNEISDFQKGEKSVFSRIVFLTLMLWFKLN